MPNNLQNKVDYQNLDFFLGGASEGRDTQKKILKGRLL